MRNDYGMVLQACLIQPSVIRVISDDFDKTILVSGDNLDETKIATDEELYYMLTDDLKVMDKLLNDFIYTDTAAEYLKLLSEKKLDLFEETYLYYYYLAIFALENLNIHAVHFETLIFIGCLFDEYRALVNFGVYEKLYNIKSWNNLELLIPKEEIAKRVKQDQVEDVLKLIARHEKMMLS